MTQHVILTKGPQGSGKSFFSEHLITTNNKYKRVNRDSFRHMTTSYQYTPSNEKLIQKLWEASVREVLEAGNNLIVDEMHLNIKTLNSNIAFIKSVKPDVKIEIKEFKVSIEEAIARDKRRPFSVGENVIRNTFKKYIDDAPERDCYDTTYDLPLPMACIFDIDGSVALKHPSRDVYDGSKAHLDIPIAPVVACIVNLKRNYKIIFLSGRDSIYRDVTQDWLITNVIPDGDFELHMRIADDRRKDSIIKKEIYNLHIRDKYNILGWFDDRIQVLDMVQKELGIFTFDLRQDCRGLNDF